MAVVIASDLAKDMAGEPLLRGVSFRLERRERLTLSGRNGSGKTTLLRMLAGESSVDGGELVLAKGTRVALHDQRPPRDRDLSLRDYVLSGAKELLAIETRLAELARAATGLETAGVNEARPGRPVARRRLGSRMLSRAGRLASDPWTTTRSAPWSRACRDLTPPAVRSSSVPQSSRRTPTPRPS